ncbi:hypothetical protein GF354_01015 [Candidatus Peregrinibacteria bacterium]|nr:hypothetical protein [Candidatus Peregrinibacteria bacterium]
MPKKTNKTNKTEKQLAKEIADLSKEIKSLSKTKDQKELIKELKSFSKEVKKIKKMEVIRIFSHPIKFLWFSLLKGLLVGFGSVLGATVLVALFIYIISKISFVPILGDFIQDILQEIGINGQTLELEQEADL